MTAPDPGTAFLDPAEFATWAKRPAWASDPLAAALLGVVEGWIRERRPDIADDDQAARVVVFEVTRDALLYGDLGPYRSMEKRTAHSSRSVTIDPSAVERFITGRHRQMLGMSVKAAPRGHFPKCDY